MRDPRDDAAAAVFGFSLSQLPIHPRTQSPHLVRAGRLNKSLQIDQTCTSWVFLRWCKKENHPIHVFPSFDIILADTPAVTSLLNGHLSNELYKIKLKKNIYLFNSFGLLAGLVP